jgi:phosphoribosylformylglycinamidine synthase
MKTNPQVLIFSGYGLNCEEETKYAFELAGAQADIVHINDLISNTKRIKNYQIIAVPGGFSFGDNTGSGKAYANMMRNHLQDELMAFAEADKLILGICNGFQILTKLGLLPGALVFNDNVRYIDRWVDLKVTNSSPWLIDIDQISLPIAHGEGKYYADTELLQQINTGKQIAMQYICGDICRDQDLAVNPNGSVQDIAAVLAYEGRVLGMMPHPERGVFFTQLNNWPLLKERYRRASKELPKFGPGLKIFANAVQYFSNKACMAVINGT